MLRPLVVKYSLGRQDVLGAEHQVIELETRAVSACCFVTGVSFPMCGNHRPLTFHELASGRFLQLLCVFVQAAVFSLAMNDAKAGDGESPKRCVRQGLGLANTFGPRRCGYSTANGPW